MSVSSKRTFTVLPIAHETYRCHRCKRKLREGERVTITQRDSMVEMRHAGRRCPPVYVTPSRFLR